MNKKILLKDLCIEDEWGKYGIPASAEEYDAAKTRYLRITDISEDGELLNNDKKSVTSTDIDKYILQEGDIVFARTGNSTGKTYYHEDKNGRMAFAGFLIKYSLDEAKVNPKYIKFFTISNEYKNWVKNLSVGSTRGNINAQTFGDCPISVPERMQQDLLVKALSLLIDKIKLNNRINAELEAMAKTLYDYWFVQFDFPDKNGKPYKTNGGKMVWNEDLKREIPEGWEVKSIDYYADVIDPHPSHRAPLEVLNGFPFAGIGDIDQYGNIDLNKARVIDEEFVLKQERDYTINEYSIGYGRVGTVGKVVKLRKQPFRFALSPTMAIINPKNNFLPSFVYYTVTNPTFLQWVNKYTSGSTRPAIGIQHLRTIPVIKPKIYSDNLLEKFERIVESSFKQTDILNKENQTLIELRDWLLPMLMNGQVKIVAH